MSENSGILWGQSLPEVRRLMGLPECSYMKCALCDDKKCRSGKDCSTIAEDVSYVEEDLGSMKVSAQIESKYYMQKTRLEEILIYCQMMGYKRLGIAFCVGLEDEARTVHKILSQDFEVYSVCCKVCGIDKGKYGLDKIGDGFEATCNPFGQSMLLNEKETELNVVIGLCVGHDILFNKHSDAPVTTFAVKDRVLAHNPLGAIYSNYYLKRKFHFKDEWE